MAEPRRYLNRLNGWDNTGAAAAAHATELPHLDAPRNKLAGLLEQARSLAVQQSALTASKQEVAKRLQQVLREGDALVDLLRTGAREHFGPTSEKLVEFGVQPFRGRARARKTPVAPPPPTPPTPNSTPTPDTTK